MRKLIRLLVLAMVVVVGAGCAKMPQSAYTPQSVYRAHGSMAIGTFTYLAPSNKQDKIKTSGGWIVFHDELPVADYIKRANVLEAENCGIKVVENSDILLIASIERLEIRDFGFSADIFYTVKYIAFKDGNKNFFIYKIQRTGVEKTPSLYIEKINTMISESFEKLLKDLKLDS